MNIVQFDCYNEQKNTMHPLKEYCALKKNILWANLYKQI